MRHGAPRDPNDYPCHCPACEPPDPLRDYFAEALCIADGGCVLLAQREHIVAVLERFRAQTLAVTGPAGRELEGALSTAERLVQGALREWVEKAENINRRVDPSERDFRP